MALGRFFLGFYGSESPVSASSARTEPSPKTYLGLSSGDGDDLGSDVGEGGLVQNSPESEEASLGSGDAEVLQRGKNEHLRNDEGSPWSCLGPQISYWA